MNTITFVLAVFVVVVFAVREYIRPLKTRYARVIARAQTRYSTAFYAAPFPARFGVVGHATAWQAAYRRRVAPAVHAGGFALLGLAAVLVSSIV